MEHLQAALRAAFAPGPAGEQILSIGRQIAYFGYLTYDMLVWVRRMSSLLFNRMLRQPNDDGIGSSYQVHQSES
jgi:hypothetical protein